MITLNHYRLKEGLSMKNLLILFVLLNSALIWSTEISLKGRIRAAHCTYVYHLRTDFIFEGLMSSDTELEYSFVNVYTKAPSKVFKAKVIDGKAQISHVTFQSNQKILYHDIYFKIDGQNYRSHFLRLRNNPCFRLGDDSAPFYSLPLEIE
jgi:hypothetical protein